MHLVPYPAFRGIDDRTDRDNFVSRLGQITSETETTIHTWALMTNLAHIFLRSGPYGLSKCMQRFLIGYAITYNRRQSIKRYSGFSLNFTLLSISFLNSNNIEHFSKASMCLRKYVVTYLLASSGPYPNRYKNCHYA